MFLPASFITIIISTALCCLRLVKTAAAAVPVTSESFIIAPQLQQQSNNATQSSNTTGLNNGLPSLNTIPTANSPTNSDPTNDFYRYPVPGTKYILYILDCTTPLPPLALKLTLTKGIANIESQIDAGFGADSPSSFSSYQPPILVEWYAAPAAYHRCPYSSLLHLWKALRLVLLDRSRRFPSWLYAKECSYRVNWVGSPGEPESVGGFDVRIVEPTGGVGGALTTRPVGTS